MRNMKLAHAGHDMKQAYTKSLVANAVVLGMVVWLSRLFGVPAEYTVAVFWFQLVVQVLVIQRLVLLLTLI